MNDLLTELRNQQLQDRLRQEAQRADALSFLAEVRGEIRLRTGNEMEFPEESIGLIASAIVYGRNLANAERRERLQVPDERRWEMLETE